MGALKQSKWAVFAAMVISIGGLSSPAEARYCGDPDSPNCKERIYAMVCDIEDLKSELTQLEKDISNQEALVAAAKLEYDKLQAELDMRYGQNGTIEEQQARMAVVMNEIKSRQETVKLLTAQLAHLNTAAGKNEFIVKYMQEHPWASQEHALEAYEQALVGLASDIAREQATILNKQKEYDTLDRILKETKDLAARVQAKKVKHEAENQKLGSLKVREHELRAKLTKLEEELKKLKATCRPPGTGGGTNNNWQGEPPLLKPTPFPTPNDPRNGVKVDMGGLL